MRDELSALAVENGIIAALIAFVVYRALCAIGAL